MNFNDVRTLQIPNGEVIKIEKDGTLWQKSGEWERNQSVVMKVKYLGGTSWTWDSYKWQCSKYNYGNYSSIEYENTIPPIGTAGSISGKMYGGYWQGSIAGKINKFTYNEGWIAHQFTYFKTRIGACASTTIFRLYNADMSVILGELQPGYSANIRNISIPLNEAGRNYFNTTDTNGKAFILGVASSTTYLEIGEFLINDIPTDGTPVFWFE